MFGLGLGEIIVITILALVFVGPKRLPEAGRKIGQLYRQFREAADTVKGTVTQDFEESSITEKESPTPESSDKFHHGAD